MRAEAFQRLPTKRSIRAEMGLPRAATKRKTAPISHLGAIEVSLVNSVHAITLPQDRKAILGRFRRSGINLKTRAKWFLKWFLKMRRSLKPFFI